MDRKGENAASIFYRLKYYCQKFNSAWVYDFLLVSVFGGGKQTLSQVCKKLAFYKEKYKN